MLEIQEGIASLRAVVARWRITEVCACKSERLKSWDAAFKIYFSPEKEVKRKFCSS